MTIVTEDQVSVSLDYLADDPHPLALARKDLADVERRVKLTYANAYLAAQGTVEERKQKAEIDAKHVAARIEEVDGVFELERHKQRVKAAEMLIAVFQTESANARGAERIR